MRGEGRAESRVVEEMTEVNVTGLGAVWALCVLDTGDPAALCLGFVLI